MAIIAAEKKKRDEKTARLRAAREAVERAGNDRSSGEASRSPGK